MPFPAHGFYTRLLIAPPGGADTSRMGGSFVAAGAVPCWAERAGARQEPPATAGPLGAAPIEVSK